MLKKLNKKIYAVVLALSMIVGMLNPMIVGAATAPLEINDDLSYSIVSTATNKTISIVAPGWGNHIKIDGKYTAESNSIEASSKLKIIKSNDQDGLATDEVRVKIYSGDYPIRSEGDNTYVFADSDKRSDQCEYIIKATGDNTGTIRDVAKNWYFGIDSANNEILRVNNEQVALEFKFVEDPLVVDYSVYIEHKDSGKLIKADGVAGNPITVTGEKDGTTVNDDLRYNLRFGKHGDVDVVNFCSKQYKTGWNSGLGNVVVQLGSDMCGGWESIIFVPNGDGTISFKDSNTKTFITVDENNQLVRDANIKDASQLTDNEKFIVHSFDAPNSVSGVKVTNIDSNAFTVSWDEVKNCIYTGYKVIATPTAVGSNKPIITSDEILDTTLRLEGLENGTAYTVQVLTVNGPNKSAYSAEVEAQTKNGPRPVQVTKLEAKEDGQGIKISWDAVKDAETYNVYRAQSAFANYEEVATGISDTTYTDNSIGTDKYANYYKIVAVNENGESDLSDEYTSLETMMFGKNMIIFAPSDDTAKINEVVQTIFDRQNDFNADAQFNTNRYSFYFKPGDYTETNCMNVGFYTSFNGLGKTPYDVKLNNLAIPAYLPAGALGGDGDNATCNFWRSAENLSVINTGNEQGKAGYGSYRPDDFNWAVAQAAPLRRVYSTRTVSYDWNYGWASGGYVADCLFEGVNDKNEGAGTLSGQQFYTRNSEITGSAFGTTLNNFFQGVKAPNLPGENNNAGDVLLGGNGYSNWAIPNGDAQQVFTNISTTEKLREKPFLFLDDDGEYKVFVPSIKENSKGISWSKDSMGVGKAISLEEFYIAREGDNAKTINEQLEAGKNIFFTPGVYEAEEVIKVNNPDTIILGTGMASIIPTNDELAMEIADVDGVTVAGLVFDAGAGSEYLLKVGDDKADSDHSKNPILLADLFFRVGGTTSTLTQAENAIVINSNDVLCDHFWIWRADHGTGVAWGGNKSAHGLIVNGDNVTCYGLFNEHFQEYDTLWNGENGKTFFYQNEKCYDPISQDTWMSHEGLEKGYSAYKVANTVKTHYAVGLGIYNVFIYTGGTETELGDSSTVGIQMENAIEVPNTPGVLVENACIQTFANEIGALQKFNHIINGCGESVSSGKDAVSGEQGEGWSRKYILNYNDGICNRGTNQNPVVENGLNPYNEKGDIDIEELIIAYENCDDKLDQESIYTSETFAPYKEIMEEIKPIYDNFKQEQQGGKYIPNRLTQNEVSQKAGEIKNTYESLNIALANYDDLDKVVAEAKRIMKTVDYTSLYYTKESKKAFDDAYKVAKQLLDDRENDGDLRVIDQKIVDDAAKELWDSIDALTIEDANLKPLQIAVERADKIIAGNNYKNGNYVNATKEIFDYYYGLGKELLETEGLDARNQALIEARAANIHNGIDQLLLMPAKTDSLKDLIKFAEDKIRDGEYFQNEYYINVAKFLDYLQQARYVIDDAKITDQDIIDQTYQDLYDAINSLELKPADYAELNSLRDQALQIVAGENYLNNRYTENSVALFNMVHADAMVFSNAYMIPDQTVVDQEAEELDKAIKGLRLKEDESQTPVVPDDSKEDESNNTDPDKDQTNTDDKLISKPTETKGDSKPAKVNVVKTGDNQMFAGYTMLGLLALGGLSALKKRRVHH